MTRAQLDAICNDNGVTVDGLHEGAGKFVDLEIGTGEHYAKLIIIRKKLIDAGVPAITATINRVTNADHDQHGQLYLEIGSFWNE